MFNYCYDFILLCKYCVYIHYIVIFININTRYNSKYILNMFVHIHVLTILCIYLYYLIININNLSFIIYLFIN